MLPHQFQNIRGMSAALSGISWGGSCMVPPSSSALCEARRPLAAMAIKPRAKVVVEDDRTATDFYDFEATQSDLLVEVRAAQGGFARRLRDRMSHLSFAPAIV